LGASWFARSPVVAAGTVHPEVELDVEVVIRPRKSETEVIWRYGEGDDPLSS
jgi:hypothetical protein